MTRSRPLLSLLVPSLLALVLGASAPAEAAPDLSEVIVDVKAEKKPVHEVLRELERAHGLNYVVSQQVLEDAGLVNVSLRQVPLEDALHAICIASGLRLQIRGRILILLPERSRTTVPAPRRADTPSRRPERSRDREPATGRRRDFSSRPSRRPVSLARAVGEVLEVDVKARRLVLDVDGLKINFYGPSPAEAKDAAAAARMQATLARLQRGHKVALEYRRVGERFLIQSLVGGTRVRDNQLALIRRKDGKETVEEPDRARKKRPRRGVTGPRNPRQAPEKQDAVPDGVITGTFVDFKSPVARVKRGDGEVVSLNLPEDAELRVKIVKVLEQLKPGARVFFLYEGEGGRLTLKSTGITEVKPN